MLSNWHVSQIDMYVNDHIDNITIVPFDWIISIDNICIQYSWT